MIKLGEHVRGKKFSVKRRSVDEALNGHDPDPSNRFINFMLEASIATCQGEFDYEPTLNKKFPQIEPTTIQEFINKWWDRKEGQTF